MTKLIVAFGNFANAPKTQTILETPYEIILLMALMTEYRSDRKIRKL
jgi:hypothetical protein